MLILLVFVVWLHSGGEPVVRAVVAPTLQGCEHARAELTKHAAAVNDQIEARCLVLRPGTPT